MVNQTWVITGNGEKEEQSRLKALRGYHVLDTDPEAALDDLVALAAAICETPIALITLIDENRQWFKARVGIELTESPLDVSICVHALHQTDLFVVSDTTLDARFAQNPMVTGVTGIR